MDNSVHAILAALRNHKGMSIVEISRKLTIARTTYQAYEDGKALPPLPVLSKLSELYNLTIDQLIGKQAITKCDLNSSINRSDLKAFTMAAMQGLMANPNVRQIINDANHYNANPDEAIAKWSISLAKDTLSELSKHQ